MEKVLRLLNSELELVSKTINEGQYSKDNIEYKTQLKHAINSLRKVSDLNIDFLECEVIEIPDKGSESYFTGYYIVDETELSKINKESLLGDQNGPYELSWQDVILRKKDN